MYKEITARQARTARRGRRENASEHNSMIESVDGSNGLGVALSNHNEYGNGRKKGKWPNYRDNSHIDTIPAII